MKNAKSVFFVSDVLDQLIHPSSLYFQSFETICGNESILTFDDQKLFQVQLKLIDYHTLLKSHFPSEEITCIFSDKGAYWLNRATIEEAGDSIEQWFQHPPQSGKLPIWKLTSEEILSYHESNLRHLIQVTANDSILFKEINNSTHGHGNQLNHHFSDMRQSILKLLDTSRKLASIKPSFHREYHTLLERCRVTRTMMDIGETTEEQLGYSKQELIRVEQFLEDRCVSLDPNYRSRHEGYLHALVNNLLKGERLQRIRAGQWCDLFKSLDSAPKGFQGYAEIMFLEQKGLDFFSANRLQELKTDASYSDVANNLLKDLDEFVELEPEFIDPVMNTAFNEQPDEEDHALSDQEIENMLSNSPSSVEETYLSLGGTSKTKQKAYVRGMAFQNRRR